MTSFCLALLPVTLSAEQGQPDRFGHKFGIGVNSVWGAEVGGNPIRLPTPGFTAGVFFHYDLGPRWSFGFELLVNQKGWQRRGNAAFPRSRISQYYADLPLLLLFGNRAGDTIYFGFYNGIPMGGFTSSITNFWRGQPANIGLAWDGGYLLGVNRQISGFQLDLRLTASEPFLRIHGNIHNVQVRIMLARVIEL